MERFLSRFFTFLLSIMLIRLEGLVGSLAMLVAWVTQLEIEAEISHSITNAEVELSFTKAPGLDFYNFIKTT